LTGTYGAIATGVVNVPVQIGNQTIERLQLFISPHVNDSLTLGRDVMSRISVRQGRLLLTLYDGEVIDTLAEDPFRLLFEVTYIDEGEDWQIEEAEQLHDVHGVKDAVMVDQSHKTPGQGVAPSILEDPTFIQVEESLQQHKGAEPRMWSTDRGALSARSDVDQKGRRARISRPSRPLRVRGLKMMWQRVPGLWGKSNLEMRSLLTNGCTRLPS